MSKAKVSFSSLIASGIFSALAMAGCGGSDPAPGPATPPTGSSGTLPASPGTPPAAPPAIPPGATATLRVAITDAPACGFDHVYITVDRVRVNASPTAADSDGGWSEVVVNPAKRIDLLSLTNGVLAELGQAPLPAGEYNQVRLVLTPNGSGLPANSVVPTNSAEVPLDTPSAQQSGLKLIHPFTVEPNTVADLVLDFDACRSVVRRGNSGRYNLKPVITVVPRTATAIVGFVPAALAGVTVTAQKNGIVQKATQPDSTGKFTLAPLDPTKGPYDVVFTGTNLTTAVIAGVPITSGQSTTLGSDLDRVPMPVSTSGTVTGSVGPAAARDTAAVRALQAVGSVPAVEVAHMNVDPATGDYSLLLSTAAPRLLVYSSPLATPLNFQPQNATAGKYKLEASATGYVTQLGNEITVVSGATLANQNFTLVAAP